MQNSYKDNNRRTAGFWITGTQIPTNRAPCQETNGVDDWMSNQYVWALFDSVVRERKNEKLKVT